MNRSAGLLLAIAAVSYARVARAEAPAVPEAPATANPASAPGATTPANASGAGATNASSAGAANASGAGATNASGAGATNAGAGAGATNAGAGASATDTGAATLDAWSPGAPRPVVEGPAPAIVAAGPPAVEAPGRPVVPARTRVGWSNPRRSRRVSAAALAFGATGGLGLVAEYLPHWVAGFGFGVGGAVRRVADRDVRGAGTLFAEVAILPVPFAVTPVIGAGFAVTVGPLAEHLPGFAGSPPNRDEFLKLVPYGRLGLRVDLRRGFYVAGEIVLAPDNRFAQGGGTHPLPALRLGIQLL